MKAIQELKKFNVVNASALLFEVIGRVFAGLVLINNFESTIVYVGYYLVITGVVTLVYVFLKATK